MSKPRPKSASASAAARPPLASHPKLITVVTGNSRDPQGKDILDPILTAKSSTRPASGSRSRPKDRGNLYKYLDCEEATAKSAKLEKIERTPVGISARSAEQASGRKREIFNNFNDIAHEEYKETNCNVLPKAELRPHPVTKLYTTFFKGIDKDTGLENDKIRSGNINRKAIEKQVEQDFQSYWLSDKSLVLPSDRIKVVTYKPHKIFEDFVEEEVEEPDEEPEIIPYKPRGESRFERMLRMKGKDIIHIDPKVMQMKAEEIKMLSDCKAQFRRSYNEIRQGLERGGTLDHVAVSDSSTLDASTLIGVPAFVDSATPADELILSAAESNVGPFFIMEFMRPLLNKEDNIKFEDIDVIDLSSKMLGDDKCLCVAKALKYTPNVRRLSLAGNALTDKSITPILEECLGFLGCTHIDISDNKIDSSSVELLKKTLTTPTCTLKELLLSSADIDDDECASLMLSIHGNTSLVYLDMSHNAIGKKEEYNSVFPDFTTGGEAISELLTTNRSLKELNISWNHICKDSALALARSVALNQGLTSLNISYNNIGDVAAQHLARSLRHQATITHLDVSYNMILPRGVMVFAHALATNGALKDINLNGNSVGHIGCSSVLRAVRQLAKSKRVINVHYRAENLAFHDASIFDRDNPSGEYALDLSSPYDEAVACWIHEIGNAKPISQFKDVAYLVPGSNKWVTVRLTRDLTVQSSNGPWDTQINNLNKIVDTLVELETFAAPKPRLKSLRRELATAVKLIGSNLGLNFREKFVEKIRTALEKAPKAKRSLVHEVLKMIFRTAFRLVVNHDDDNDCWLHKENLVKCFHVLGFGASDNDMRDKDKPEDFPADHSGEEAPEGAGPRGEETTAVYHARHGHVHSNNYELKAMNESDRVKKEDKELVDRIHHIEAMERSGRERLVLAERIIAGQNFDGTDVLDEANFIRMMLTNFTEFSPPPANPLIDMSTNKPWKLPVEGKLRLKFICDRMPPSNDELQSRESFAIFSKVSSIAVVGCNYHVVCHCGAIRQYQAQHQVKRTPSWTP
jgi:hypothetical protein